MLLPVSVHAAEAKIELTSSVKSNNNVFVTTKVSSEEAIGSYEYTLDYDHDKLELVDGNPFTSTHSNNNETKSFENEFKFKIKSSGSSEISVISYSVTSISNKPMTVKVKSTVVDADKEADSGLSDNNFLSSLEVENFKISPSFNKDITSYELSINQDITEINIKATPSDSKAKVDGAGKHILNDGQNKIKITVTSESKDERVYTILVTLKEKTPLTVKVNGKDYTVLKNIESIKAPEGYKLSKSRINGKDVESFYNEKTKLTLVALKDENDKVSLFIYDAGDESYVAYNEISIKSFTFIPLPSNKKLAGYKVFTEVINEVETKCLKLYTDSSFCVLYGIDTNTNEKGFYTYDIDAKTIQRYNKDIDKYHKEKLKNTRMLIYILSGSTLIFGIMTIAFAVKSDKKKKR